MKTVNDIQGQPLVWIHAQPQTHEYVLRTPAEVLAVIRWKNGRSWVASADTPDASWVFQPAWLFRSRITVKTQEEQQVIARFKCNWHTGVLKCADGSVYYWTKREKQTDQWVWRNRIGVRLMYFQLDEGGETAQVEIEDIAQSLTSLSLLATLGWYIITVYERLFTLY